MRVFVEDLEFVGFHGVYEDERVEGREYVAHIWADVPDAGSDVIESTLDYRRLAEAVLGFGADPDRDGRVLLETLSSEILTYVLNEYPEVSAAGIRLRKRATGVPGNPRYVGVELEMSRGEHV